MPGTSGYPGAIDDFIDPNDATGDTLASVPHDAQHGQLNRAVNAIETTLGVNPQGVEASVAARLDAVDAAVVNSNSITSVNGGTVTLNDATAAGSLLGYRVESATTFSGQGSDVLLDAGVYVIERVNGGWRYHSVGSGTSFNPDTVAPTWTATLTTGVVTNVSAKISASALATDNVGVTEYEASVDSGTTWQSVAAPVGTVFTITGLTPSTAYPAPQMRARDADGNRSSALAAQSFTTAAQPSTTYLHDAILAKSPDGYWPLLEESGTVAADVSGNGRDGTYTGTVTLGGVNGFPNFDGGYVKIPHNDAFTNFYVDGTGLTIFMLAKLTTADANGKMLITKATSGGVYEWDVEVNSPSATGALVASCTTAAAGLGGAETTPTNAITANTWHAAGVVFSPDVATTPFPVYVDSGYATASTWASGSTITSKYTGDVCIGSRQTVPRPWLGALGHVAIFHRQLSEAEMKDLMDAARADGLIP